MNRILFATIYLTLHAAVAWAQDIPISKILLANEGWREVAAGYPQVTFLEANADGSIGIYQQHLTSRLGADGMLAKQAGKDVMNAGVVRSKRASYAIDKTGVLATVAGKTSPLALDLASPSCLTLWPDGGHLVIGETQGRWLWAVRLEADGTPGPGDRYYSLRTRPGEKTVPVHALVMDAAHLLYAATPIGIQCFDPTGRLSAVIAAPAAGDVTALAIGGPAGDTLFAACGAAIYARRIQGKAAYTWQAKATPPEGFTAIFNGRDLTGWEGSPMYWRVEDGSLTGTADGTLKYNRFIVWRAGQVKNFDLRVQVRVTPGGNSGIQYRGVERPDLGDSVVTGYQCDVVANRADYNGMLYEERGRRILAHTGEKVIIDTKGQPWVVGEMPVKDFKAGEWHDFRVLVRGNHHQHWIDEHLTVDVVDLDEAGRKLAGVLAVQVHVGPAMKIQYRDIYLKHLPDDLPIITTAEAPIPATARQVVPQGKDRPKQ